jgi:hypothetical protein
MFVVQSLYRIYRLHGGEGMAVTDNETRTVRVYDPTADEAEAQDALAARFGTLDGKVVGLLNNTKDRTEIIFEEVESLLEQRFPGVEVRQYRKHSVSGLLPELFEQINSECDAVVSALGD